MSEESGQAKALSRFPVKLCGFSLSCVLKALVFCMICLVCVCVKFVRVKAGLKDVTQGGRSEFVCHCVIFGWEDQIS